MAELIIQTTNIKNNIQKISTYFEQHNIHWSLITKVFSGDKDFLQNILSDEVIDKIYSVGDSRLTSLKNLKAVNPNMRTIYIKPPAIVYADEVVKYADISLNSSFRTLKALDEAAQKANKTHHVIIMIEMGELREGVTLNNIVDFYEKAVQLPNIQVVGVGSNLGCMYGIEPTYDKLHQLALCKKTLTEKFNRELRFISGGTSITLPLIESGKVPQEINHFRIGEAAFFGRSPLDNKVFLNLSTETFSLKGNVIELAEKKIVPEGDIGDANIGHAADFDANAVNETSVKAILDFGMLDVDKENIDPIDEMISFVGITSDMLVVDLGDNQTAGGEQKYKVGDQIEFSVNYMAVVRLLNSKFIDKIFVA